MTAKKKAPAAKKTPWQVWALAAFGLIGALGALQPNSEPAPTANLQTVREAEPAPAEAKLATPTVVVRVIVQAAKPLTVTRIVRQTSQAPGRKTHPRKTHPSANPAPQTKPAPPAQPANQQTQPAQTPPPAQTVGVANTTTTDSSTSTRSYITKSGKHVTSCKVCSTSNGVQTCTTTSKSQ